MNRSEIEFFKSTIDFSKKNKRKKRKRKKELKKEILTTEYFDKFKIIAKYLTTLQKSSKMTRKKFRKFKKKTLSFKIQEEHFFRRNNKNILMRQVINSLEKRLQILTALHDKSDHREKKEIYRRVIDRY